jgi:hypothetical protein
MRFFVSGLVLIVIGIGLTEYNRRHPSEFTPKGEPAKKVPTAPVAPPTMTALIARDPVTADAAGPLEAFTAELQAMAVTGAAAVEGFTPVLKGAIKARDLKAAGDGAVLLLEKNGQTALVHLSAQGVAKALTVRTAPVAALWFDVKDQRLVWGEDASVKSISVEGGEVKTVATFTRALVTSVAASGGAVLVALVPKDGDPFSADPNGAVALLDGADTRLLALDQIRPRELAFDGGDECFFVSGYPSGLTRAALDGSFTSRIVERADGPVALEADGVTYRFPQTSGPELRRAARGGGATKTLARVDVEWLAVRGGVARYTTTGFAPRLYEVKAGDEPKELLAIKGAAKGLAWATEKLFVAAVDDDGVTTLSVK